MLINIIILCLLLIKNLKMLSSQAVNNFETPSNKLNKIPQTSTINNPNNLNIFCKDLTKINDLDECDMTPLYRTIIAGDVSSAKLLLDNGANPNVKCTMGETALYQAVELEKIEQIKLLLKNEADPNITNADGLSPLHAAVNKQNIIIVKLLLKYGANPNLKSKLYQQTPLHLAIKNNADPIFLLLLVQFNGSLLKEDKFNKKPVDYTNSKEMQNTIEKLKFGIDEIKIPKEVEKFETPSKGFELTPNNVYSNTLRSKSKGRELVIGNNNAVLKKPGSVKLTIIDGKNNIISNNKNELISNNKQKEMLKKELFILNNDKNNNENSNEIIKQQNKESINSNEINESYKSLEESIELEDINYIENKEIDYPYLRKHTGKFGVDIQKQDSLKEEKNLNNSLRSKSIKINMNGIKHSDFENVIKKPIRFSFVSNTFNKKDEKKFLIKTKESIELNEENKENINNNINIDNNDTNINSQNKRKTKSFSNQSYNNNKNKKKIIIKQYFDKEEKGNIKNQEEKLNNFDKNNCLYEKIIKKSITKIEIYDDNKESTCQTVKKDSKNELSKTKSSNKSLYNKPILKPKKIKNLKKNFKKEDNSRDISVKLNKRIVSEDKSKIQKKVIFPKKLQKINPKYKNFLLNNKNAKLEQLNNNTLSSNSNKNNKRNCISCSTTTTLTSNGNEYIKNLNIKNTSNQKNSYKFGNDSINHDKMLCFSYLTNNLNIETSNEYSSNSKFPIFYWLKEIGLHCYYNLFLDKKIVSMNKVISYLKSGKFSITKTDIEKIGIIIHGHIYRIITKLEIDAGIINSKISNYFLKSIKQIPGKDINSLNNSIYFCCGCCSSNERKIHNTIKKDFSLENWLKKTKMIKYKQNFIDNGFDLFEFFILQMFSSLPIDDYILKDELKIENEKDRDIILLRLNKEIKYIMLKTENHFDNGISLEENSIYEFDAKYTEKNSECMIV